jgi:Flp pilus assembly protein TadG
MKKRPNFKLFSAFAADRRASNVIEFAISGLALFGFFMAIVNIGLLGMSVGALERGVQGAARQAATSATLSFLNSSPQAFTCPAVSAVQGYFKTYAVPALSDNATISANWTNNGTGAISTKPAALYVTVTAKYTWKPLGFPYGSTNIPLQLTTIALVTGSNGVASSC